MPTERRGGRRQGRPGQQYPNRTDLQQAPRAAPGQTYGAAKAQKDAQKVVPLRNVPAPAAGVGPSPSAMAGMMGGNGVEVPSLSAPSTRPNEPLTAGLPTGPGPGPEALNLPQQLSGDQNMLAQVQALYQAYPNDDLGRLMAELSTRINTSRPKGPGSLATPPRRTQGKGVGEYIGDLTQSGGMPSSGMGANAGMMEGTGGLGPNNAGVMG